MPTVRKLTSQEVQTLEYKGKGKRKLIEEQYDAFLADYGLGDYGEAELDEGENRLTVRNRFKAAAARRRLGLVFQPTRGNVMRFRIAPAEGASKSQVTAPNSPPKRGGRRRVSAATAR